jgi:hypothetical protein
MSTRKNRLVLLYLRIKKFPFFMLFPLRCLGEVLDGAIDILCLFRRFKTRAVAGIEMAEAAVGVLKSAGPLDLADIDIKSSEARVRVKILLR